MDQSKIPSFEIPKSPDRHIPQDSLADIDPAIAIEGTREILPPPQQQPTSHSSLPSVPSMSMTGAPIAQGVPTQATDDSHLVADDVDVVEKEWVERAKKIISLTAHDPYVEAKELSKLKSAYMKKRFNKDLVPMPEDAK